MDELVARTYHENSKIRRYDRRYGLKIRFINESPILQQRLLHCFKRYRGAVTVGLPPPEEWPSRGGSFEDAALKRRSIRHFLSSRLELRQIAKLLYFGAGLTGELRDSDGRLIRHLRTAPSGGGLYPVELYLLSLNIEGLDEGVYHYCARENLLELVKAGSFQNFLDECLGQPGVVTRAAGLVILTAILDRTLFKYEERGYRFILLETGHIAQNLLLAASAMDVGAVAIGGFIDEEVERILEVDGFNETALYMVAVGAIQAQK